MSHFQINPFFFPTVPPLVAGQGTWRELGRTTLGGISDDVIVSGLDNVEYYMILADMPETANLQPAYRFGDSGSPDTGTNYASNRANNGAQPTTTSGTDSEIIANVADTAIRHWFEVNWVSNLFNHEKLLTGKSARNITGNATAPFRSEYSGKWVNDKPIDTINLTNLGVGDFQIGTELVVLGYSRFDDGTQPNFWELLGEKEAVGGETSLTTPIFAPKKYLWIQGFSFHGAGGGTYQMRIGHDVVDSGSNYYGRFANFEFGAGTGQESPNQILDHLILTNIGTSTDTTANYYCINTNGVEKILHGRIYASSALFPAPARAHSTVKWDGQSLDQITIAQIFQTVPPATLNAGSKIQVWGHD